MWAAWDHTVDVCLSQLPQLLADESYVFQVPLVTFLREFFIIKFMLKYANYDALRLKPFLLHNIESDICCILSQSSPFFEQQLTAFEVWLSFGVEKRIPPEQLPIVLQVWLF